MEISYDGKGFLERLVTTGVQRKGWSNTKIGFDTDRLAEAFKLVSVKVSQQAVEQESKKSYLRSAPR